MALSAKKTNKKLKSNEVVKSRTLPGGPQWFSHKTNGPPGGPLNHPLAQSFSHPEVSPRRGRWETQQEGWGWVIHMPGRHPVPGLRAKTQQRETTNKRSRDWGFNKLCNLLLKPRLGCTLPDASPALSFPSVKLWCEQWVQRALPPLPPQ